MPINNGVGWGEFTHIKLEYFEKIISMHLIITKRVLPKWKQQYYHYIDATSGRGKTDSKIGKIDGSTLIFLKSAKRLNVNFKADFIEKENENCKALYNRVGSNATIYNCNYGNIIHSLPNNKDQLGLLFIDHSGDRPLFEEIARFSNTYQRMEILFYLSASNLKRELHITDMALSDYLKSISKKYWMVREPFKGDNHQWTFLLGSNTDIFTDYKSIDFYRLDSKNGKRIFPIFDLTNDQRKNMNQLKLELF